MSTATKPKPKRASKAEIFAGEPIETDAAVITLYTAQDAEGKYYGSFRAEWRAKQFPNQLSKLTSSRARKFDELLYARLHGASEALDYLERLRLDRLDEVQLDAVIDATTQVRRWRDAVAGEALAEPVAPKARSLPELAKPKRGGRGTAAMPPIDDPEALAEPVAPAARGRVGRPRPQPVDPLTLNSQLDALPLDKLRDHPGNPDPTEAEILEMMSWLSDGQQDEPITVRPLPDPIGHYEVLAGKRRLAAARRLGLDTLDARIRRDLDDDRDAAAFAARNNLERRTENDLRKAHWLRYQVDVLGLTVADAACAMGIAQGTASNIMAVGELCEQYGYWRERIIAGEMSGAHLRPIKKYRGYPVVMKLLIDEHRGLSKAAVDKEWVRSQLIEDWGTREAIEYTIAALIVAQSRALTAGDQLASEGALYESPRFAAATLTHEQRKQLKIVEIPAPGDKSEQLLGRCFGLKAWRALQDAAKKSAAKKSADRSSREPTALAAGSGKPQRTAAEQKRLDKQRDDQLVGRIKAWRHAWLKSLLAARLAGYPEIVARLRAWLQTEPFSGLVAGELDLAGITIREAAGKVPLYRDSSATWATVAKLSIADVERISLTLCRAILEHEDRDPKCPRLKVEMVDDLARMAGVDVAGEWAVMQQSSARPVQWETFFWLHDIGQLTRLAAELKVDIAAATTKKQLVARLSGQPRRLPLPKSIAPLKQAASKKARKK